MKNIPYIGIYGFDYEWLPVVSYSKSLNHSEWNEFVPALAKLTIKKLMDEQKLEANSVEYLSVNYNISGFRKKFLSNMNHRWVRFNLVFHSYFMDYLQPGLNEEKKYIMASIYTKDIFMIGLRKCKSQPIMINSTNLFLPENWIEMHIHRADENDPKSLCVSPNNASVLIDMASPIIPFFTVAIEKIDNQPKLNILITHHCIVDDHDLNDCSNPLHVLCNDKFSYLYRNLMYSSNDLAIYNSKKSLPEEKERRIQAYCKGKIDFYAMIIKERKLENFDEIKYFFDMFIWDTFISCKIHNLTDNPTIEDLISCYEHFKEKGERQKINQIEGIFDSFLKYVWSCFTTPIMDDFGLEYIKQSLNPDYTIHLLRGFGNYIGKSFDSVLNLHVNSWKQRIDNNFEETKEEEGSHKISACFVAKSFFSPGVELQDSPANEYLSALENHCSELMTHGDNIEGWAMSLMELPEVIQGLIFNTVWSIHGRIDGIHPDFGRSSYINSDEITQCYWMNSEQRLDLILNLIECLRNSDTSLIK